MVASLFGDYVLFSIFFQSDEYPFCPRLRVETSRDNYNSGSA